MTGPDDRKQIRISGKNILPPFEVSATISPPTYAEP
jgi:hypothetical protein